MSDPRPLPPPISDEDLEAWRVEVQYGTSRVIPITRSKLGAILARLEKAEELNKKPLPRWEAEARREIHECLYGKPDPAVVAVVTGCTEPLIPKSEEKK